MISKLSLLAGVLVLVSPATGSVVDVETVYGANCASCHGADGKGRTPAGKKLRVKDLAASTLPDAEMEKQITAGTQDAKGNQRMPAFKDKLSAEEIAALVAFVKTLRR
jgi:cytochrome c6